MPTVVRETGFAIRLFTRDHPPPHVHVERTGAMLKIDLGTCEVVAIAGRVSDQDIRRAERIVKKHAPELREHWERLHGHRTTDRTGS